MYRRCQTQNETIEIKNLYLMTECNLMPENELVNEHRCTKTSEKFN